jgi:hypothetical protein
VRDRQDFVQFQFKPKAPGYVAFGGARFSGIFRREAEPFEATRGEWKAWLEPTGFFEIVSSDQSAATSAAKEK